MSFLLWNVDLSNLCLFLEEVFDGLLPATFISYSSHIPYSDLGFRYSVALLYFPGTSPVPFKLSLEDKGRLVDVEL